MAERSPDLDRTDALPGATPSPENPAADDARTAALAMLGRRLGEFVLVGRLGEGGFGTVYRAEQPALGREAVVKILHARHRERGDWAKRFLREAQLASRLEHPYAAHIYAFGAEPDGLLWIAMELVRGMPLDRLLAADGPLPVARFVPLLERICEVVHTAHEQGVVHRDIKPANVMVLSRAGRLLPKLLDFGIAKLAETSAAGEVSRAPLPATTPLSARETMDVDAPSPAGRALDARLTRQGSVVGSPLYMAPEQWVDSSSATARTDIYALGVLAYECLTGKVPFHGPTLPAIEEAHRRAPVPPLPPELPATLHAVFATAMAKHPDRRFASALDLARAVRGAAGLDVENETLPQLDDAIRQTVVADWPQPIAEAVAGLDAVRNLHQARDAVWDVVRALVRWVGLTALAARSQIGGGESDAGRELVRALGRRELGDDEWRDLARELVRPFRGRARAHPLPALVQLWFPSEGTEVDPFAALLTLRHADQAPATTLDDPLRALVTRAYTELGVLLGRVRWLGDHLLAVVRFGMAEVWSGVRRPRRALMPLAAGLEEGSVILVDGEGRPLLRLSPLVQIAPPHPGAADEAFLFTGASGRGTRMIALPTGFERTDPSLRSWLAGELLAGEDSAEAAAASETPPYRGLAPFGVGDADRYFGREAEVEAVRNRLRVQPLLTVVGPSGAGKSSFVHAGLAPRMAARVVSMRPGATPLAALEAALAGEPDLLVIDQLEELVTQGTGDAERRAFAERVCRAAGDTLRVVMTLRDDFLGRVQALPGFRERLAGGLELLGVPGPEQLRRALVEPARRAGYRFEDEALPDEMVAAVADLPSALPLLSFAAAQLWEQRDRHFRLLTRRAHDALGGVTGALAAHAEAVLAQLPVGERELVRAAFRALLTAEGTRQVLGRAELVHVLGGGARAERVTDELVAARLLVAGEGEGGQERIEIVHEALATAWPRLVEWRRADADGARLRDQLRAAARQWEERGRPSGLLWRDDALGELRRFRAAWQAPLTPVEEAFAAASDADARRSRRRRLIALVAAFAALSAGLAVLAWQRGVAERFAEESRARLIASWQEQGREALLDDDPMKAIVYLSEVQAAGVDGAELRFLISEAARPLERARHVLDLDGLAYEIEFSPDGATLATVGEGGLELWDVASGRRRHSSSERSTRLQFAPRGGRFATATGADAVVRRNSDGDTLLRLAAHKPTALAFSPDGERLATAGDDRAVRLWNVDTGALEAVSQPHAGRVRWLAFRPGGGVASADLTGGVQMWNGVSDATPVRIDHGGRVAALVFDPGGTRLLTAGEGGARIWDPVDGHLLHGYPGHGQHEIIAGAFAPDGAWVVTGARDGGLHVWQPGGASLCTARAHGGELIRLAVAPSGLVFTVGDDRNAFAWEPNHCRRIASFAGHTTRLMRLGVTGDGARLATSAADGTARLWDLEHLPPRPLDRLGSDVREVVSSPDGGVLAVAGGDGVTLVALGTRVRRHLPHPARISAIDFSPSGDTLTSGATDGRVRTWDLASGALRAELDTGGSQVYALAHRPGREPGLVVVSGPEEVALWQQIDPAAFHLQAWSGTQRTWDVALPALRVAFIDERRLLATALDGAVLLIDPATGARRASWAAHSAPAAALAVSPTVSATGSEDASVLVWTPDGHSSPLGDHDGEIGALAIHPDGSLIAVVDSESQITVWGTAGGRLLRREFLASVRDVAFSPDGSALWAVTKPGVLWSFPIETTGRTSVAVQAMRAMVPPRRVLEWLALSNPPRR